MDTFKERLELAMADNNIKNGNELVKAMGIENRESVYRILRDDTKRPGFDVIESLFNTLTKTNTHWLITGKGNRLLSDKLDISSNKNIALEPLVAYKVAQQDAKAIPLVDNRAAAGFGSASFSIDQVDVQAHYVVPDFERIDFMLRVVGNSMWPKYNSGDVVACRIIKNIQFIQWGKPYLIAAGEQGLIIKTLMPTNDARVVECVSYNKEFFPPFLLNMEDIHGLALIVGTIRLE